MSATANNQGNHARQQRWDHGGVVLYRALTLLSS